MVHFEQMFNSSQGKCLIGFIVLSTYYTWYREQGEGGEDGNDIVGLGVFRPVRRACLEQDLNTSRCFKCFGTH